jgi:nucleoside-diphosphate-sugar epimerase
MIAISGKSGFIGSHLSEALSKLGHKVLPISRELLYLPNDLEAWFLKEKPEYIFHLAAYGNMANQTDVAMTVFSNIIGITNMLMGSLDVPYKKFINFSTSSVTLPTVTFYSASKQGGEAVCNAFAQHYKKPILSVRPYSIFGQGEADFRFIPTVCRKLIKGEEIELDPTPVHDWVYIGQFVDELLANLDKTGVLEIGTGVQTSNQEIVDMLEKISGKKAKIKLVKGLREYDSTNWKSKEVKNSNLEEGLRKTYESYR